MDGDPSVQSMITASLGGRVELTKTSGDASVTEGDGDYSLEGAVYGVYDGGGSLVAKMTTDVSGHATTDGKVANGTYTVKEISAPAGYVLSNEEYQVTVSGHDAGVDASDQPVTVRLKLVKTDSETVGTDPQGAVPLDGAVYEATYEQNGQEKTVTATTEGGEATFEGIPLGTVTVREVQAPEDYLLDTERHTFEVSADTAGHDSAVYELTPDGDFAEQVERGDLELVKVADSTQQRLAGVPFKVTSKTTGESHVIVTDANGQASTAANWNLHTQDTDGGTARSGVWFGASEPDDARGALPYDTYAVEEQRCDANADRALIPAFDVSVYKDSTTVQLGTLTDDEGPAIGTEATDASDGDHSVDAKGNATISDDVTYTGLTPGREYKLVGTLMDKETGKAVQREGGDVTAEATFTPAAASGVATVTFEFDASGLAGRDVVAFEELSQGSKQVATHADIDDEGQTVQVAPPTPQIGTTATDADDGDHEAVTDDSATINDEVSYTGLTPGQEYQLTGTLMDKQTGGPVKSGGKTVASTVSFVPDSADGTQTVTFTFDGADLAGHDLVAFESLSTGGQEVAAHADIDDEGQTVNLTVPHSGETPEKGTPSSNLPQTGDDALWDAAACALGAAGCAACVVGLARRRRGELEKTADNAPEEGEE